MSGSRGFILAHLLGPTAYGVLGSLIALQQMLSYAALGMREGVLIRLSKPDSDSYRVRICTSAILFAAGVGLLLPIVVLACAQWVNSRFDANYLLIGMIGGMSILNEVLVNINRHEGRLIRVSVCESSYNLLILVLIFTLQRYLSVFVALTFMLAGITLSVAMYLLRLTCFAWREARWSTMTELVSLGFFSSVLSAVLLVVNLGFILLAQRHLPGEELGQYVFANNIGTVLLVSLNAFSWAMTSRSMRALAERPAASSDAGEGPARTDFYLRLGVTGALLLAVIVSFALPLLLERYAGASRYIVLLVALQSFQFIIFTELTYLMMRNRIPVLIAVFALANLVNLAMVEAVAGRLPFPQVMVGAVACTAIAAVIVMFYARAVGMGGELLKAKLVTLTSVLLAAVLFATAGAAWAGGFLVICVCVTLRINWYQIRTLFPTSLKVHGSST